MNPKVLLGMFVGAMMSFLFCGLTPWDAPPTRW